MNAAPYDLSQLRPRFEQWLLLAEADAGPPVAGPGAAAALFLPHFMEGETMIDHERLVVLAMDSGCRVIEIAPITVGSAKFTLVDPAQIMRWVLTRARPARSFALAHNHPSGDPGPSPQDLQVTRRLGEIARLLDIPLVDHLIFGRGRYVSLASEGYDMDGR